MALQLVKKLNEKTASESSSAAKNALIATHPDNAVLSSADQRKVLLSIEASTARTQSLKKNAIFHDRALYPHAASLLKGPRSVHSTAYETHPSSIREFLLSGTPQTKFF